MVRRGVLVCAYPQAAQVPAVVADEAMDAFVKDVPNAAYTVLAKAAKAAEVPPSVAELTSRAEVVDVTGQLNRFNFQWARASGFAAGQEV
jgi:hypothetical protein